MKQCPYCTTNNRDEAVVCFYCGLDLRNVPPGPLDAGPTQPIRAQTYTQPYIPPAQQPMPQPSPYPAYAPVPTAPVSPFPAQRRQNHVWQVVVLGLGLVLLAACGLAAWTIFSVPGSRGVAGLIPLSAPTATLTPIPTPTLTPEPTATEPPAATPAGENGGGDFVREKLLSPECAAALEKLSSVSNETSNQPLKLLDSAWRDTLNQSVADMKTYCGTLESASPVPGQVAEVRQNLSLANNEFDEANRLWSEGVEERNPGKILEAGQHIGQAAQYLNLAMDGLKNIVQ